MISLGRGNRINFAGILGAVGVGIRGIRQKDGRKSIGGDDSNWVTFGG